MIKITDGNAFILRVQGITRNGDYEAEVDLSQIDSMTANFVRRGRSTQESNFDSSGRLLISNEGTLDKGVYGVEMVGYYNGQPWRSYAKNVFEIVNANADADEADATMNDVPIYDVTIAVTLGGSGVTADFVDAMIAKHSDDETSHPYLIEKIDDAGKVDDVLVNGVSVVDEDKVADIPVPTTVEEMEDADDYATKNYVDAQVATAGHVDDVKVNGQSVVDNKEANIDIPTTVAELEDAADYATNEGVEEALAAKQDTITEASVEYTEDGGSPDASVEFEDGVMAFQMKNMKMKFSELTAADKEELKGAKGDPGESAVFDPETGNISQMQQTTGDSIVNPMSQKAVSDYLGYHIADGTYIFESTPSSTVSVWYPTVNIPAGTKFKITIDGLGTVISGWRCTFNNDSSTRFDSTKDELEVTRTYNITRINIQILAAKFIAVGTISISLDVGSIFGTKDELASLESRTSVIEGQLGNIGQIDGFLESASKQMNLEKIIPETTWNDGKLSFSGKKTASTTIEYSSPIEVNRNDIIHVKAYAPDTTSMLLSWVVNEDYLYDMISIYTSSNAYKELTIRAYKDGFMSVCRKKGSYTTTIEIYRGVDESMDAVLPVMLRTTKVAMLAGNGNLFNLNAYNGRYLSSASAEISSDADKWMTGFIELPSNVNHVRWNYMAYGNYNRLYDEEGTVLKAFNGWSPIEINLAAYPTAKYIRLCFDKSQLPFSDRHKLVVSGFWQETDSKPYSMLDSNYIGVRDKGIFQLSDLNNYSAELVFGTYVDDTTFSVGGEDVELDLYKAYIDKSSNVLYRWDGTALSKACMWTDRGKVFTKTFSFEVLKSWHKENMIVTTTAKWTGENSPTIRLIAAAATANNNTRKYTMKYIFGAKDNYSTKEWRAYNLHMAQEKTLVAVVIPEGTTLVVDEFTNYYSNRKDSNVYPMWHYRSGNTLNQGLIAWEEAAKLGYEYIIVIPKKTADGKWVIFHDDSDINSMKNEDGTSVTNSNPIGTYTYDELMQLDISGTFPFNGNKLPLLEDFFALCAKRGIHPCFSVHPNFTTEEWQEVRALSDKWGVTKHLNLKAGYILGTGCLINTAYPVFGDDVESYYVDINRNSTGVSEVQNAISQFGIDTSKVRVGIEYFHAYATDANIQAARAAGIPVGVVTDAPSADGSGGDSAIEINHWIELGVSSFTDVINPSVGLNW